MAKMNAFKKFLIIIGVLVAAVAIAVVLYMLTPKASPAPPKTDVSLTVTPYFNSCKVISTDSIKNTTHGALLTGVSDGLRTGTHAPNGTIADSCGYTLTTKKSKDNTLSVDVYPYTATVNGDDKETVDASWSQVSNSNLPAYFGSTIDGNSVIYSLRVIPGGKNIMFALRQPVNAATFDQSDALDFLTGIAAKADFSVVNVAATN